jgi:hypothetical protein
MKIIEALKEIPLIQKKLDKNLELIRKYSSDLVVGDEFVFESEQKQRDEVASLMQSSQDLIKRRMSLKRQLLMTNAQTQITISELTLSITEWIEFKNWGITQVLGTLSNLNESNTVQRTQLTADTVDKGVRRIRFYDETYKNERWMFYTELQSKITAQLEIVNATTDLIETV